MDKVYGHDGEAIENAEEIIKRFGGIRPMATKMGVPVTTVQGWKKRDVIPANRIKDVIAAAEKNNIELLDIMAAGADKAVSDRKKDDKKVAFADVMRDENRQQEDRQKNTGRVAQQVQAPEDGIEEDPHGSTGGSTGGYIVNRENPDKKHEEAIKAAERRFAEEGKIRGAASSHAASSKIDTEMVLGTIKVAERRVLQKSVLVTIVLIAFTAGLMAFLFAPQPGDDRRSVQRLDVLETEIAGVKEKQTFFERLIPANFREDFETLKRQTKKAQESVAVLSAEAGAIKDDLIAPGLSMTERLGRLEQRVDALGAPAQFGTLIEKIRILQGSVAGQEHLASALNDLALLVNRHSADDGVLADEELEAVLSEVQEENNALGQTLHGVSKDDLKAGAMLVALTQFRSAVNRDKPFAQDLAVLQKILGTEDDAEMQEAMIRLAPHAENGVMSPSRLKQEFSGLAGDIVMASLQGEDVSVQEKAKARMHNLLSVEKDGELITGTDTQATVARAQKLLDAGDVQGAIAELQSLDGDAKEAAFPWIEQAQASLLAGKLDNIFTGKVANEVSQSGLYGSAGNTMNIEQWVREIKSLAPKGRVIMDDRSDFIILERSRLSLPQ